MKSVPAAAGNLIMIDDRSICLTRRNFDPKNPAGPYVLEESTYLVSGKIDKYSNSSDVYLRYMNSFYHSDSEASR